MLLASLALVVTSAFLVVALNAEFDISNNVDDQMESSRVDALIEAELPAQGTSFVLIFTSNDPAMKRD